MQLKFKEALNIYMSLKGFAAIVEGQKLSYNLSKNLRLLQSEAEALDKFNKGDASWQKFNEARQALVTSFAEKNEDGSPKTTNNGTSVVLKDVEAFNAAITKFREEQVEAIKSREVAEKEWDALLESIIEVTLHQIPFALFESDKGIQESGKKTTELYVALNGTVITDG